jgi:hypothetical protein
MMSRHWNISTGRHFQNGRQNTAKIQHKFESQHSLRSDILVGRESGYLKIFFYISRGEYVKHFVIDAYL